jgi:hypothetical protein
MAILDHLETYISINGLQSQEYDDLEIGDPEEVLTVTKYIEAMADANFTITTVAKKTFLFDCDYIAWSISLDGEWQLGAVTPNTSLEPRCDQSEVVTGINCVKNRQFFLKKFKFGNLEIS